MLQSSIFRWPQGAGWLVLSGGGNFLDDTTEAIDSRMLTRSAADGALAYIWAAHNFDKAEQYLEYLTELGGRYSYPVDIIAEDDESLNALLGEAGVIVIGDGANTGRLFNGLQGAAINAIRTAHYQGALVMAAGPSARMFGQWFVEPFSGELSAGLGWVENATILSGLPREPEKIALQQLLNTQPYAFGLNIGMGSALVLGPNGNIELWGDRQVAISLGQDYSTQG